MKKILFLIILLSPIIGHTQLTTTTVVKKEIYYNKFFKQKITISKIDTLEIFTFSYQNSNYTYITEYKSINFNSRENCKLFFNKLLDIVNKKQKDVSEIISIDKQDISVNYLKIYGIEGVKLYNFNNKSSTSIKHKDLLEIIKSIN